jgi:hypothetical protein
MEILIQSLLSTMILTYFNHFEFRKSFVKWNSHSKSIVDNDSHLLQPLGIQQHFRILKCSQQTCHLKSKHGQPYDKFWKKTAHKQSSLIISSMEIKKLKSPSLIL